MFQNFNSSECDAYLQYKHHKNDGRMPKSVGDRRKHCIEVMLCESPLSSPHSSGIKDEGDAEDLSPNHEVIQAWSWLWW